MTHTEIALDPLAGTLAARGRSARRKGHDFERDVARMLSDATGVYWRRKVRQHAVDSDVVTDSPAFQHLVIECKHADTLCLPRWWAQACKQAGEKTPVLIYRQTGSQIRVQLDASDVNPATWPARRRNVVTLDWDTAMQWMRETAQNKSAGDSTVLGE